MSNIAKLLRKVGAEAESNSEIFQQVVSAPLLDLLEGDEQDNTSLHVAVILGLSKVTEALIARFKDADKLGFRNCFEQSALDIAVVIGNNEVVFKILKALEEKQKALEAESNIEALEELYTLMRDALDRRKAPDYLGKLVELESKIAKANLKIAENGGPINSVMPISYSRALMAAVSGLNRGLEGDEELEKLAELATRGIIAWIAEHGSLSWIMCQFSSDDDCAKSKKFIARIRKADSDSIILKLREENALAGGEVEFNIINLRRAFTALRIPTWNQQNAQNLVTTSINSLIRLIKQGAEVNVKELLREYFNDERCKPFVQKLEDATMKSVNSSQEL